MSAQAQVSPIAIMGDYNEVKDTIFCFPTRKLQGYVYLIVCSNFLLKVGRSSNIVERLRSHEYGLRVYGFNRIEYAAITNPTSDSEALEKAIKIRFASQLSNCEALTEEWFRTGNIREALRIFTDALQPFTFEQVTTRNSVCDELVKYLEKYFTAFKDETHLEVPTAKLYETLSFTYPDTFPLPKRAKHIFNAIALRNPHCIEITDTGYRFNRNILLTDLVHTLDPHDKKTFEQLEEAKADREAKRKELRF